MVEAKFCIIAHLGTLISRGKYPLLRIDVAPPVSQKMRVLKNKLNEGTLLWCLVA